MMGERVRWLVGVAVVASFAAPAAAQQRPLLTEDPEPVGEGLVLLEAGLDHAWGQPFVYSGLEGNLLRGPLLGFSFGMGAMAEIQFDGISRSRLRITDRVDAPLSDMLRAEGDTTSGYEDFVIGAKVRLVSEGARRPAFALRFATRLPMATNETGLGPDTMDFFQSVLVGKTVQSVRVVANIGVGILSDPIRGDRQDDVVTYGLSLARALVEGTEVVAEVNGQAGDRTRGRMTFGLRYTRGSVRLDSGLFAGFTSKDPRVGLTAGLTWVFSSPLGS